MLAEVVPCSLVLVHSTSTSSTDCAMAVQGISVGTEVAMP